MSQLAIRPEQATTSTQTASRKAKSGNAEELRASSEALADEAQTLFDLIDETNPLFRARVLPVDNKYLEDVGLENDHYESMALGAGLGREGVAKVLSEKFATGKISRGAYLNALGALTTYTFDTWGHQDLEECKALDRITLSLTFLVAEANRLGRPDFKLSGIQQEAHALLHVLHQRMTAKCAAQLGRDLGILDLVRFAESEPILFAEITFKNEKCFESEARKG